MGGFKRFVFVVYGLAGTAAFAALGLSWYGPWVRQVASLMGTDWFYRAVAGLSVAGAFGTLLILLIGVFAFVMDTIGGVLLAKFMNLFSKKKINPMVGAAGISAFPMSSRVVQKMAMEEDPGNVILMHAAGANVSGQVASVIAGGMIISLVTKFL